MSLPNLLNESDAIIIHCQTKDEIESLKVHLQHRFEHYIDPIQMEISTMHHAEHFAIASDDEQNCLHFAHVDQESLKYLQQHYQVHSYGEFKNRFLTLH